MFALFHHVTLVLIIERCCRGAYFRADCYRVGARGTDPGVSGPGVPRRHCRVSHPDHVLHQM